MQSRTNHLDYIVRNKYSYCFRICVPMDLRPFIGKTELRYSLKTGYLSVAKNRERLMAGLFQECKDQIRRIPGLLWIRL